MGSYEEFLEHEEDRENVEEYDIERDYAVLNQKESSLAAKVRGFFAKKEDSEDEELPEEEAVTDLYEDGSVHGEPPLPASVELVPGEPPEGPPERRTSDEQIEAMLSSVTGEAPDPEDTYEEG